MEAAGDLAGDPEAGDGDGGGAVAVAVGRRGERLGARVEGV